MFNAKTAQRKSSAVRKNILPKKAVSNRWLLWLVITMVVVVAGFALKHTIESASFFPVEHVRIEGEFRFLDKEQVKEQINQISVGGFFDLDIAGIRNELMGLQWVEDAFVRREWPNAVVIRVVEKQPVAIWNSKGILTASSHLFYPEKMQLMNDLVKLEGPLGRHTFVLAEFNRLQALLYQADIQVARLSQNERRSWKMKVDGIDIHLGRKDIEKKIQSFAAVYQTLLKPKMEKVKQIDFRYTNGFAVQWRKDLAFKSKYEDANMMSKYLKNTNESFLMGAV